MKGKSVEKWEVRHCYRWCARRATVAGAAATLPQLPGASVADVSQYD